MEESISLASVALMAVTSAASFTALFFLFQQHIAGIPFLEYEPRRRVPWGLGIALIAMLIPLVGVVAPAFVSPPDTAESTIVEEHTQDIVDDEQAETSEEPSNFIVNGLFTSALMIVFVTVLALVLRDVFGADRHDFGLPETSQQMVTDVGLGVFACLASMLPIYATMYVLNKLLLPETEHPLIETLQQTHTPAMMLVGILTVVIAAPVFEEFAFRLLLQGWLEKWEDECIGYSGTTRTAPAEPTEVESSQPEAEAPEDAILLAIPQEPVPLPRGGLLQDLPHGWLPILISGTLFGLAHWGHGVSPVPLVLFGIVLGYLYQRTHRLVPSITAHALFNTYSMVMLWLSFS